MKFVLAGIFMLLSSLTFAHFYNNGRDDGWRHDRDGGNTIHGVPGPIAGAGLPVLAIGFGVYWLVKRRKKSG